MQVHSELVIDWTGFHGKCCIQESFCFSWRFFIVDTSYQAIYHSSSFFQFTTYGTQNPFCHRFFGDAYVVLNYAKAWNDVMDNRTKRKHSLCTDYVARHPTSKVNPVGNGKSSLAQYKLTTRIQN